MKIAIDIDDTITKTKENNQAIMKKYNYIEKSKDDFDSIKFNEFVYIHQKEILNTMEPKENASEVINRLYNDNEIIILSSRNISGYIPYKETIDFFYKYNIPYNELILGIDNKGEFALKNNIDLIIDDSDYHLEECNLYNINCIKFGNDKSNFFTTDNWLEVEKYVKEMFYGENNRCKNKRRGFKRR